MNQVIATMYLHMFLLGRFERAVEQAVESARETGATFTRFWHSKQPVYIIGEMDVVHDVKTSNHKMKSGTNIVWNARTGNIAKPGLTLACACAPACCRAKGGARQWSDAYDYMHSLGFTGTKHWNVSYVKDFHIVFTVSSEEVLETTSQHLNLKFSWGAKELDHYSLAILLLT